MPAPSDVLRYRGRFAPSPTGPLHMGSLVAAVASFCDARAARGEWLVRIEDVDTPRSVPGSANAILRTLERFGLAWDGPVVWQSARTARYRAAFERLVRDGHVYGCACTRREIADSALTGVEGPVYPGTCRAGLPPGRVVRAHRVRVPESPIAFDDRVQGRVEQDLAREVGDFVVLRADGLFAYQLAVVVDDAEQGITHVVRGADLLASTPRQIHLMRLLGYAEPAWMHVPVAVDTRGEKLSKQTQAPAVDMGSTSTSLGRALAYLGHAPPVDLGGASAGTLLEWAVSAWQVGRVPHVRAQAVPEARDH